MKFRRKPLECIVSYHDESSFPWKVFGGETLTEKAFKDQYEPIDDEARKKWKEVYDHPKGTTISCHCGLRNKIDMKSPLRYQTLLCPQCGRRIWIRTRPHSFNENPLDPKCPLGEEVYEFEIESDWRKP